MNNTSHVQYSPEKGEPESNYHALFEQAKDAIMVTDFQGNFKDVNSGLCNMFGYTKQELLKMNVRSLLDSQHLQQLPIRFDLLAEGENIFNERQMVHKNGSIIYVESNAKKFLDNRILVIARDVTERKKIEQILHESEANLQTIFETTDTIYVLMDTDLQIISCNSRAVDFAKKELDRDFETGKYFLDYFPSNKKALITLKTQEALAGYHTRYESKYTQPNGTENWYHVRVFPISRNNRVYGLMMAVSDITEKKLLEKKLLDQSIEEQKKITRAVLKAQEIERNKIGQELHDNVNQVLTSIRLYLGMIDDGSVAKKDLLDKSKEYIDLAINEIRALSREQVTPQRKFNLKELIDDLCTNLNEHTPAKTKFHCNVVEHLHIDEDLKLNLYRIVQEQTNNILKYAGASKATISIHEQNNFVHVLIIDNGKGFDPLVKRKGIGISNMINRIESYNGEIHVESSPGNGCKIEMAIPVCKGSLENDQ